jgi:RimJ/RimL family protein N-acetyltransferase
MAGLPQGIEIRPIAEEHIAGFHATIDSVARERRYVAMLKAFPLEETAQFVRESIRRNHPHLVAIADGKVVGWCDIQPLPRETMAHGGVLGMGLIDGYRERGIGLALIRATLDKARANGMTRVELTLREDNLRAKALYDKVGFAVEGVKRKASLYEGKYYDLIAMALLL